MASHPLIDDYAFELGRRLPGHIVDELVDGLIESYERERASGAEPATAAAAAIAEFGAIDAVVAAFVRESPGRRVALALLATGPVVGTCWGMSLGLGQAWQWPLPRPATAAFGLALIAMIATLVSAATSRNSYGRTRLAVVGSAGLIVLDAAMVGATILVAPALVWPMAAAIPASTMRIGITMRFLPRMLASSA